MAKTLVLAFLFLLFSSGCANGPARYKMLGYQKYATAELPRGLISKNDASRLSIYVLRGAGILIDATVVALDGIMTPIVSTNLMGLPEPGSDDPRIRFIYIPFSGLPHMIAFGVADCISDPQYGFTLIALPFMTVFNYFGYLFLTQTLERDKYETFFGKPTGAYEGEMNETDSLIPG